MPITSLSKLIAWQLLPKVIAIFFQFLEPFIVFVFDLSLLVCYELVKVEGGRSEILFDCIKFLKGGDTCQGILLGEHIDLDGDWLYELLHVAELLLKPVTLFWFWTQRSTHTSILIFDSHYRLHQNSIVVVFIALYFSFLIQFSLIKGSSIPQSL